MHEIATLSINPAVDLSFEVERIFPTHKMRGSGERHDPGGGGINVARVLVRLGANARCHYLSGGAASAALDRQQIVKNLIGITEETRISTTVLERESGREYRFTTDGPQVSATELEKCLDSMRKLQSDYLVMSGSLPRGAPDDFYAQVTSLATRQGVELVLDSSGRGLSGGLSGPQILLVKPSIGELRALSGRALEDESAIVEAANAINRCRAARHVAVTMGHEGAILVSAGRYLRLPALPVEARSAAGRATVFWRRWCLLWPRASPSKTPFASASRQVPHRSSRQVPDWPGPKISGVWPDQVEGWVFSILKTLAAQISLIAQASASSNSWSVMFAFKPSNKARLKLAIIPLFRTSSRQARARSTAASDATYAGLPGCDPLLSAS